MEVSCSINKKKCRVERIVKRGNGGRCEEEAESSDCIGTQEGSEGPTVRTVPTSLGGVDKETGSYETDHLDTDEWTIRYLTPDLKQCLL